jgi:hypothetical protein
MSNFVKFPQIQTVPKKIAFPNPIMLPGCFNPATTDWNVLMAKSILTVVPSFRSASSASNWLLWKFFFASDQKGTT